MDSKPRGMDVRKVIITLCYNTPETVQGAVKRLKATQDLADYEYYLIDVGYPIPSRQQNFERLVDISRAYSVDIVRPFKNRGVSMNWMWAMYELGLNQGDVLIGMDPDSQPVENGWCDALSDVLLNSTEPMGYVGLTRTTPPQLATEVDESNKSYTLHTIAGRRVRKYSEPVSWPMGGFNVEFMRKVGVHQPRTRYGFIEIATIQRMQNTAWDWCMLHDFHDQTFDRGEPLYQEWKIKQAQGRTTLDFADYIREDDRP